MSKKMFSRERGKLRFSALLILIGLLLFGCDPTMVTITYNANGGEGEMKPQAVESGVEVKLIANTFTKDGSDFTGWNEAADGSGKAYADGATVTPTGNLTLYAQWQVKSTPENPGTENPGTENPGTEDPGTENPGTEDPEDPVVLEDHITNLALIHVVEETYKLKNDNAEIGWTKTAEGYVDMTNETNKTLVAGVTSLGSDGDMSLDGIEYFTGLQELILENNSVLTELPDLTSFSNLRTLVVTFTTESTAVSSLTAVSGLPSSLVTLDLSENKLTELDVSQLTDLTHLNVSVNELTELDINKNTKLTYLACYANRMGALDITKVEAFSQSPTDPPTSILTCGIQRNDNGTLTLTATQEQQDALASLFSPVTVDGDDPLDIFRLSNYHVVWDVPKAELDITEGTAVFNKTVGLTLSFSGSTLPEDASASVSLNGTPVDSQFNGDRNAVIVALAALTNDTVGMTVTVTVSAAGYNDAVLRYEGVNTVWIPDGVTATFDNTEKIGGESVSVTISQADGTELSGVTIDSGTYSVDGASGDQTIDVDGLSFTAPILEDTVAKDIGTEVTISLVLAKANAESVTVSSTLKVYPETHVRFDGEFYALAKGFNFTSGGDLANVTYTDNGTEGDISAGDDGFTFTVDSETTDEITLPTTEIDDAVLTMFDLKWNDSNNANVYVTQGTVSPTGGGWGFSVYKKATLGTGSFLLGGTNAPWQPKAGSLWSYEASAGVFDQYFIYDNGTDAPKFGRGSVTEVFSVTGNDHSQGKDKFSSITPFTIYFGVTNSGNTVNYTLRAVNFYKPVQ